MIINPRLKGHAAKFRLQTLLVIIFIFVIMMCFLLVEKRQFSILSAIGISSLASSAFILFFLPHSASAAPKRAIGGYFIAIICGVGFHLLTTNLPHFFPHSELIGYALIVALSVGCAIFFMCLFGFEHPPATSFAVGIVLQNWNILILIIALVGITILAGVKHILRDGMVDIA